MKTALGFLAVMAVVYFVVPIAAPTVDLTLMQSAAITLLAYVGRVVLAEGVAVKLDGVESVEYEIERTDDISE